MKISLFAKEGKPALRDVISYLKKHSEVAVYTGKRTDIFPVSAFNKSPDIVISYLSPWIIPEMVLKRTRLWNINFHPGPPEYPGIGCFNFAIYNGEKTYGVTSHIMDSKVDTGRIIGVKRFALIESDSLYDLSIKSYKNMLSLFFEIMDFILEKKRLPDCNEVWKREPFRRKDLEALCKIDSGATESEILRKIRATRYPDMPGAYIELHGNKFEYNPHR